MQTLPYVKTGFFLALAILVCGIASQAFASSEEELSDTDFQKIGSKYGVSPYLLLAVSIVESQRGKLPGKFEVQKVVDEIQLKFLRKIARHTGREVSEFKGSRSGAMGYMQILPVTFYMYGQEKEDSGQKEVGFKYKIDTSNSIKVQIDDEDDFLGVEHKIEF